VPDIAVRLPTPLVAELLAVVRAALQNVVQHAGDGAHAWVFLDVLPTEVSLTIRDDGTGMDAQRLAEAAAEGRLGVVRSIRGRIDDLGGSVVITSSPGHGTELEITVPLNAAPIQEKRSNG